MTRDEWCAAFVQALQQLRPHLAAEWGTSRIAWALAMIQHDPAVEPAVAARRYHAKNPPAKAP